MLEKSLIWKEKDRNKEGKVGRLRRVEVGKSRMFINKNRRLSNAGKSLIWKQKDRNNEEKAVKG